MIGPRRRFLPVLEDSLETRVVPSVAVPTPSHAVSLPQAIAIKYGSQTHPTGWGVKAGSSQTVAFATSGVPHHRQLVYSVRPIRSPIPQIAAQEAIDPNLNSFKLNYHNGSNRAYSSATFVVRLAPGLRYIPGSEHIPSLGKLTVSKDSTGVQTLTLALPNGVPARASDYLIFQTKYYK